jgi:3-hydroxyacyl-CoA dehydrogenase
LSTSATLPKVLEKMMENGDRGVLNGRGFYQYGPDDAAYWEALLHERAWVVYDLQKDLQKRAKPTDDPA